MAAEYFLYTTLYNNTLVNRSKTSFAPLPPNTGEIFINYFIPTNQPLYYYRESGGTIVLNSEETINNYLTGTASPPDNDTFLTYEPFTGYTATTKTQLDTKVENNVFSGFTGTTLPANYYNKTEINNYSGTTATLIGTKFNTSDFNSYSANTDTRINGIDNDINFISGVTDTKLNIVNFNAYSGTTATLIGTKFNTSDFNNFTGTTLPTNYYNKTEINSYSASTQIEINSKIPKIAGATQDNIVLSNADGTVYDSGISIDNITGGTGFYYYIENDVSLTNGTATDVSFISGTSGILQAGTWSIDFSAAGGQNNPNKDIVVGFYVDGVLRGVEYVINSNDAGNRYPFALSEDQTLTAGTHTFEIRFRAGGGTAVMVYATIRARLVS